MQPPSEAGVHGPVAAKVGLVIHYRSFRNTDPPALAQIWNEAFIGRGAVKLAHSSPLEFHVLAKPYFDPAGLILALDDGVPVGFGHAGFGPNEAQSALDTAAGVICAVGVRPTHRRRGIATELLRHCETYLNGRGARTLHAGQRWPLSPFYLGLYGGSDLPGFLASDPDAEPFLTRQGYRVADTILVLQRRLDKPLTLVDPRFAAHRRQFEVRMAPRGKGGTWWRETVLGPVEVLEFQLAEKGGQTVARADLWEMEGFRWRWNVAPVGLLHVEALPNLRRQGLAKFLIGQMMRWLQEQYFNLVEVQIPQGCEPAVQLFRALGFEQVDTGKVYHKA